MVGSFVDVAHFVKCMMSYPTCLRRPQQTNVDEQTGVLLRDALILFYSKVCGVNGLI